MLAELPHSQRLDRAVARLSLTLMGCCFAIIQLGHVASYIDQRMAEDVTYQLAIAQVERPPFHHVGTGKRNESLTLA